MITIQIRQIGKKKRLFSDWSMPLPPSWRGGDGSVTLRDLISRIVREEVRAFLERQNERRLTRALSLEAIEVSVTRGKVDTGGRVLKQRVDEETAVAVALQAFEDGLYLVVIDEEEQRNLDAQVYLHDDSIITFVRLVFLAGA